MIYAPRFRDKLWSISVLTCFTTAKHEVGSAHRPVLSSFQMTGNLKGLNHPEIQAQTKHCLCLCLSNQEWKFHLDLSWLNMSGRIPIFILQHNDLLLHLLSSSHCLPNERQGYRSFNKPMPNKDLQMRYQLVGNDKSVCLHRHGNVCVSVLWQKRIKVNLDSEDEQNIDYEAEAICLFFSKELPL